MRRFVLVVAFATLTGVACSVTLTQGQEVTSSSKLEVCKTVSLSQKPGWAISGWFDSGTLYLVDALNDSILRYTASGESRGPVGDPLESDLKSLLPVTGKRRTSDSPIILEVSNGLLTLDKHLRPSRTHVVAEKKSGAFTIKAIWQWEPVGESEVIAFAELFKGEGPEDDPTMWRSAFVRFPLGNPSAFKILHPDLSDRVALKSEEERMYFSTVFPDERTTFRLGYNYLASVGDTAYILSVTSSRVTLYKNRTGTDRLEDISDRLPGGRALPGIKDLPDFILKIDYADVMAFMEKQSVPTGLYSWKGRLYYMSRSPKPKGTRWALTRIDLGPRRESQTTVIPIEANHVTVVPGDEQWAFLAKGPVRAYGVQAAPRLLLVRSETLETSFQSRQNVCN